MIAYVKFMPDGCDCIGVTYADVRHMDMLNISFILSFTPEIRKKARTEKKLISHRTLAFVSAQGQDTSMLMEAVL